MMPGFGYTPWMWDEVSARRDIYKYQTVKVETIDVLNIDILVCIAYFIEEGQPERAETLQLLSSQHS